MKISYLQLAGILILNLVAFTGTAQKFYKAELSAVQPGLVIIENFSQISLPLSTVPGESINRFDKKNLYTYIQRIGNDDLANFQLIYQTSFTGKLLYLGCSNNMFQVFNNPAKPMNVFMNCMKKLAGDFSGSQQVETAIACIIDRLNYCVQ